MNTESTEDQSAEIEVIPASERVTVYVTATNQIAIYQRSPMGDSEDQTIVVAPCHISRLCRALRATAKNAKGVAA